YNVLEVGKPMYYFYGLKCLGIWMNQAEIDASTAAHNGNAPKYNNTPVVPGDLKHEDINGDNNITPTTSGDMQYLGKPAASFVYGMTNRFTWKNFDASVLFTAQTGGYIYGTIGRAIDRAGVGTQSNIMGYWRDQWWSESEPGNGIVPFHRSAVKPDADSRFLYKSDYFRVKNLTLGYKIPFKSFIQSARIYVSLENLLILDNYYHGYSPETSNSGTGMDYGAYPSARTYTFGLNINF
ncbi:MAG: SusC/RagA family TonB-linked outer membrane protein, partial [Bacteroidales bacterium]|nr:SusC/RagA family TonB-linked outer membrane protein [Bacteroidales bacterium]